MIIYKNRTISRLVDLLNAKYPKLPRLDLVVMNGYPAVETDDGVGYGAYRKGENPVILMAGQAPEECTTLLQQEEFFGVTFLHEYRHFMQDVLGEDLERLSPDDEEDAEQWAEMAWVSMGPGR